jgi:hypothetical protein
MAINVSDVFGMLQRKFLPAPSIGLAAGASAPDGPPRVRSQSMNIMFARSLTWP